MTIGDKIRKYRTLKNMTQKQLGEAVGFKSSTADVRINQYETGKMAPKEDIRAKLADTLDIDIPAISDVNIQSFEDLMYVFFELEELFGVQIDKKDGKTYLSFDDNNKDMSTLITYMNLWKIQKSAYMPNPDNVTDEQAHNYQVWKSKFASNINNYFTDKENEIANYYKDAIKKTAKSYKYAEKTSEITLLLRSMIEAGFTITTNYDASYRQANGGPGFIFSVNELLSPPSEAAKDLFTKFMLELNRIVNLGINYTTKLQMQDNTLTICYNIPVPSFGIIKQQLDQFIEFHNNKDMKNDVSKDLFETQFKADLNTMYNFIEKEVEHYKNYQN